MSYDGVVFCRLGVSYDTSTLTLSIIFCGIQVNGEYVWRRFVLDCLRVGGVRVSAHLGEPRGWWRSSSRPWPQRPVCWWLARRPLLFKKKKKL
ncbi:hypothetical protein Hanom_Chr16g01441611 [Helianthus anomalus]